MADKPPRPPPVSVLDSEARVSTSKDTDTGRILPKLERLDDNKRNVDDGCSDDQFSTKLSVGASANETKTQQALLMEMNIDCL